MMQKIFEKIFSGKKEKIEITVETSETWEIHSLKKTRVRNCHRCGSEVIFIPADLCGKIVEIDTEALIELTTNGKLHSLAFPGEENSVCLKSLNSELKGEIK